MNKEATTEEFQSMEEVLKERKELQSEVLMQKLELKSKKQQLREQDEQIHALTQQANTVLIQWLRQRRDHFEQILEQIFEPGHQAEQSPLQHFLIIVEQLHKMERVLEAKGLELQFIKDTQADVERHFAEMRETVTTQIQELQKAMQLSEKRTKGFREDILLLREEVFRLQNEIQILETQVKKVYYRMHDSLYEIASATLI